MDYPEIFNDWYWNLEEDNDDIEVLFDEWRWNLEITEDLTNTETDYNEFNYWKVTDNLKIDLDSGCLADSEDDCRAWTDCMFWQDGNDNWSIIHNLVNDVVVEDNDEDDQFFHNYWDENAANQSIIKSLLDDGDDDNWSIIHNLVNDVVVEDADEDDQFFHNYWDENAANQSIIKSLLDDGDYDDDDMSELQMMNLSGRREKHL